MWPWAAGDRRCGRLQTEDEGRRSGPPETEDVGSLIQKIGPPETEDVGRHGGPPEREDVGGWRERMWTVLQKMRAAVDRRCGPPEKD
jgi:hypothetical protein